MEIDKSKSALELDETIRSLQEKIKLLQGMLHTVYMTIWCNRSGGIDFYLASTLFP